VETLDNIVTAVSTNGFFIQTPPGRSDGAAETSDGIGSEGSVGSEGSEGSEGSGLS
jgi:predicted extracellular nuclease